MHTLAASAGDWAEPESRRVEDAAVVREQARPLFRYARSLGADAELAEDFCQEAFVVAWQKQKQSLPAAALATYLRRSVRNLWLQHVRSDRRRERAIAAAAESLWVQAPGGRGDELVLRTRACIEKLQGRAARAVDLAYREGVGRDHIAADLGMKPNGVKTLLARTRRWLEQCIRRQS